MWCAMVRCGAVVVVVVVGGVVRCVVRGMWFVYLDVWCVLCGVVWCGVVW